MSKDIISINIPGTNSVLNIVDPKDKLILIKVSKCDNIDHIKQIVKLLKQEIGSNSNCNVLVTTEDINMDIMDRQDAIGYIDRNISMLQEIKDLYKLRRAVR